MSAKPPEQPEPENDEKAPLDGMAKGYAMASEFAITLALGVIAGYGLWKRTPDSSPLWLMVGVFVGTGLGLYRLIGKSQS